MLKIGNLKAGDIIIVNDEGVMRDGTVVSVSHEENQALVDNGVQEFWYSQEEMFAIPLDEGQLMQLGFTKEESDGAVKYKKDSFRLVTPKKGDFSNIEMWWREDRRHFSFPLGVHELQNLFHDMTKVPLFRA
jgi:predicted component of type VI protein secretion system